MVAPVAVGALPKVLPGMVAVVATLGLGTLLVTGDATLAPPVAWPLMAARKVVANLVASAFFKYTTWILPLAWVPLGWSSLATKDLTKATRAGLAARKIKALLRDSASRVVLYSPPVWPGVAEACGITLLPDPLGHAHLLKRNRNLGLNVYWATFLAALTAQAGVFALQVFRSTPDVAIFALAVTMSAPLTMLPGAMGTAYFSRLPGAIGFPPRVLACAWGLSIAVATVFCLVAPLAVNVLYGDHYDAVTSSAQLCAVGAVLHGMGDVYNRYYLANRQTNLLLRIAFLTCFVSIIACIPAAIFFGPLGVGAARLIASALYVSALAYKYHGVRYRFGPT